MNPKQTNQPKQAFVPPSDRPKVQSASNSCPGDWSIRSLAAILNQQLPRTNGSSTIKSTNQNPGLMQKCCEKRHADLYDLMGFGPSDLPGLESLIQVEAGLTKHLQKPSRIGKHDS